MDLLNGYDNNGSDEPEIAIFTKSDKHNKLACNCDVF